MLARRAAGHRRRGASALAVAACAAAVVAILALPPSMEAAPAASTPAPHPGSPGVPGRAEPSASSPNGSVGSLEITLYNPGPNATGVYDQPVGINSSLYSGVINSNWSNGIAGYTANATPVYGWIESGASNASADTLLWLRLDSIPAHGWTNVSIWFWPKAAFNLSENGYLGENPELSQPYAAFDNGWRVFDEYANFSGSSLSTAWTPLGGWAGSVNNGLRLVSSVGLGAIELPLAGPHPENVTVDAAVQANGTGVPLCLFLAAAPGFSASAQFFPSAYALEPGATGVTRAELVTSNATGAAHLDVPAVGAPVDFQTDAHVVSLAWRHANSTETGSVNYVPFISQVDASNSPMAELGLGTYCVSNCSSWSVGWVRARSVPSPMPTVSGEAFSPVGVTVAGSPTSTDVGRVVGFSCNASASGLASPSYAWAFGDGGTGAGRTTVHAYALPGTFEATCTVTGRSGDVGDSSARVRIAPSPAILLFQAVPATFALGGSLNLVTNITGGTPPFRFSYNGLPSGCPGNDTPAISCLPGVAGTYAIEVIVVDAVGEETSAWVTVSVTSAPMSSGGSSFTAEDGYALAGAVAGVIILAGVLPVLLWSRRTESRARTRGRSAGSAGPEASSVEESPEEEGLP